MRFSEFRAERIEELRKEERCVGGGCIEYPDVNSINGLLELIKEVRPRTVIEVGCGTGVSTECFLLYCQRVVAVDPFLAHWANNLLTFHERLQHYPNLDFLQGASPNALDMFADDEFDMCYIDGEHYFQAVARDIYACERIVKPGGWMAGHDCLPGSEVEAAVKQLAPGEPKIFPDSSWLVRREVK